MSESDGSVEKVNSTPSPKKRTNDVTRRVPQPTDTGYKLFLAWMELVCFGHARSSVSETIVT